MNNCLYCEVSQYIYTGSTPFDQRYSPGMLCDTTLLFFAVLSLFTKADEGLGDSPPLGGTGYRLTPGALIGRSNSERYICLDSNTGRVMSVLK